MSHPKRALSEAGIYHITERGVGKQIIFEDYFDRKHFGNLLLRLTKEGKISLLAWCFMDNHVHLLVQGEMPSISIAMRSINSAYAHYFNERHTRTGTLFQDRFFSKPIKSDEQFAATLRYIHKNPAESIGTYWNRYIWSSYREFFGENSALGRTVNVPFVFDMLGGKGAFFSLHERGKSAISEEEFIQEQLIDHARSLIGNLNVYDIRSLPKAERNEKLRALHNGGLSIRQIERITSIGRGIIAHAVKDDSFAPGAFVIKAV